MDTSAYPRPPFSVALSVIVVSADSGPALRECVRQLLSSSMSLELILIDNASHDGVPSATGPRGVPGLIVVKRLIMQGFIVMDFMDQRDEALSDLQSWVASGKLKVQEDIINGLENTPKALIGLLAGENRGKRMVKL